jgi:quinoprotein glucose dehydrogenase
VKAVAQPTKQNFLYVFDRVTGKPIWPMEEKPVPQGETPGEWYSKTQPFPSKPPAYDRQGVSLDDLINFTPELHEEAVKLVSRYQIGPLFTPPVVSKVEGPLATLASPGPLGGANWPGGAFDPETHRLYVFSQSGLGIYGLVVPDPKVSDMNYIQGIARPPATEANAAGGRGRGGTFAADVAQARGVTVQGLPLLKPPYGRITAFDMDKGEILWQVAHGETPDNIKNSPALKGLTIERTGRTGIIGTLVTKTLVIAGEAGFFTTPNGQRGAMLRAYDKATGKEVGAVYMPAPQSGSPMTYMLGGKQYVVIAISGGNYSGEYVAFRLP